MSLIADSVPVRISRFSLFAWVGGGVPKGNLPHFLHGSEAEAVLDRVLTQTS